MRIGLQLYTVRNEMAADTAGTLAEVAKIGYKVVEVAGFNGKSAHEFAKMLQDNQLRACGMHSDLNSLEHNLPQVLDDATAINAHYIVCPWLDKPKTLNAWIEMGMKLSKIGEKIAKTKHAFLYHNHWFEFEQFGNVTGYQAMFDAACSDCMGNEIDLWWAFTAGQDPVKMLEKYGSRVHCVHLKDGEDIKVSKHAVAGQGLMKWPRILKACDKAKVEFGIVEFDNTDHPLVAAKGSLDYFHSLGYRA